ncbi:MAG: YcgN family cysteine cluster protein [Gammaproteobacteria bacterium]|nr:YcgN family cysteine cluster protein [Gammaproteobacteria bacterium]
MERFWEIKKLEEMNQLEWESLCDQCAKCCTVRLEDIDTGSVFCTSIACKQLNPNNCQCRAYKQRTSLVTDCITITPELLDTYDWLPSTCAYQLVRHNMPLPEWHPLKTGNRQSTLLSGNTIQGTVVSEEDVHPDDFENYILENNW